MSFFKSLFTTKKEEFTVIEDVVGSNNGQTISSTVNITKTVFYNKVLTSGVHNFSFKIEKTATQSNIMVGVSDETIEVNKKEFLSHHSRGYGYYAWDGAKYHNKIREDYGEKYSTGDVVGIKLDLDKGTLEFSLNEKYLGIAYKDIKGPVKPCVTLQAAGDSITYKKDCLIDGLILKQTSSITDTVFVHGSKIALKTSYGGYFCYINHQPTVVKDLISSCYFIVEKIGSNYKFKDSVTGEYMCTSTVNDFLFTVTENRAGYSFGAGGKFLGANNQGKVFIFPSSISPDTVFFVEKEKTQSFSLLKENVVNSNTFKEVKKLPTDKVYFMSLTQGSPVYIGNDGSLISHAMEKTYSVISKAGLSVEHVFYYEFKVNSLKGTDWMCFGVTSEFKEIPTALNNNLCWLGCKTGDYSWANDGQYFTNGILQKDAKGNPSKSFLMSDIVSFMILKGFIMFFKNGQLVHKLKIDSSFKIVYPALTIFGKSAIIESVTPKLRTQCENSMNNIQQVIHKDTIRNVFKEGDVCQLRTVWNTYFCYINDAPTAIGTPSIECQFKIEYKDDKIIFRDNTNAAMVTGSVNDYMMTITPNKDGYSIYSGGKYLGVTKDNRALVYTTNTAVETVFYPEFKSKNQIKQIQSYSIQNNQQSSLIQHGRTIAFKSCWGTFVYYNQFFSPSVSKYLINDCKFKVEQVGSKFKFKDPRDLNLVACTGTDNTFTVTEYQDKSYSLLSDGGSYLGVSNDGRVLLYKTCHQKETKFYPVVLDNNTTYQVTQNVTKKSIGIFGDGQTLCLKSKWGTYFYYDDDNYPCTSMTKNKNCKFTIEQYGDKFKLRTINFSYACTSKSTYSLFTVVQYENPQLNGYSLFSGEKYLGISKDGKVLCYDNDKGWESRWFPEPYVDQPEYVIGEKEVFSNEDFSGGTDHWKISDKLLASKNWQKKGDYDLLTLNTSDEEYQFVANQFTKFSKKFKIKSIVCINNEQLSTLFEHRIDNLALRMKKPVFQPKWEKENQINQRKKYLDRFNNLMVCNRYKGVSIVPVFHGCRKEVVYEICETGFANLKTTDSGYFGSGIYGSPQSEYAGTVYGEGVVMLCFMSTGFTYPVVHGDMDKLMGKNNYANFDSHFVPVYPRDMNLHQYGKEKVYFPCTEYQTPIYDELVVFQESQIVPRYVIYFE